MCDSASVCVCVCVGVCVMLFSIRTSLSNLAAEITQWEPWSEIPLQKTIKKENNKKENNKKEKKKKSRPDFYSLQSQSKLRDGKTDRQADRQTDREKRGERVQFSICHIQFNFNFLISFFEIQSDFNSIFYVQFSILTIPIQPQFQFF